MSQPSSVQRNDIERTTDPIGGLLEVLLNTVHLDKVVGGTMQPNTHVLVPQGFFVNRWTIWITKVESQISDPQYKRDERVWRMGSSGALPVCWVKYKWKGFLADTEVYTINEHGNFDFWRAKNPVEASTAHFPQAPPKVPKTHERLTYPWVKVYKSFQIHAAIYIRHSIDILSRRTTVDDAFHAILRPCPAPRLSSLSDFRSCVEEAIPYAKWQHRPVEKGTLVYVYRSNPPYVHFCRALLPVPAYTHPRFAPLYWSNTQRAYRKYWESVGGAGIPIDYVKNTHRTFYAGQKVYVVDSRRNEMQHYEALCTVPPSAKCDPRKGGVLAQESSLWGCEGFAFGWKTIQVDRCDIQVVEILHRKDNM